MIDRYEKKINKANRGLHGVEILQEADRHLKSFLKEITTMKQSCESAEENVRPDSANLEQPLISLVWRASRIEGASATIMVLRMLLLTMISKSS